MGTRQSQPDWIIAPRQVNRLPPTRRSAIGIYTSRQSRLYPPSLGRVGNELASFRGGARRQDGEAFTNPTNPLPEASFLGFDPPQGG